jgi:oligopeptide/dipeptide ABC transporter ATP-binding protein
VSTFDVSGLTCVAGDHDEHVTLLDDVSFSVAPGEVVGLIGESGSGKTMAALAVLSVLPDGVHMTAGEAGFTDARTTAGRPGHDGVAAIFQNPRDALNPVMRIGRQMARVLRLHGVSGRAAEREASVDLLRRCGVPGAAKVLDLYPHQLSGGMCQRVMIAMAVAARPRLLIADEPTTALDMTVQAQIIELLRHVVADTECGVLLITHDLGVVAELCDRVVVLLGGRVMERAETATLFANPRHPYTRFLMDPRGAGVPALGAGAQPSPVACPFITRCPHASMACDPGPPPRTVGGDHDVACVLVEARL